MRKKKRRSLINSFHNQLFIDKNEESRNTGKIKDFKAIQNKKFIKTLSNNSQ